MQLPVCKNLGIHRIPEPSLTSKALAEGLKEQDASELDPVSQQEQQEQAVSQMDPRGRQKGEKSASGARSSCFRSLGGDGTNWAVTYKTPSSWLFLKPSSALIPCFGLRPSIPAWERVQIR